MGGTIVAVSFPLETELQRACCDSDSTVRASDFDALAFLYTRKCCPCLDTRLSVDGWCGDFCRTQLDYNPDSSTGNQVKTIFLSSPSQCSISNEKIVSHSEKKCGKNFFFDLQYRLSCHNLMKILIMYFLTEPQFDAPTLPAPHPDHQVESTKVHYHTKDKSSVRRDAIVKGADELVDNGYELCAVVKKKQRMNLIRLYQQSNLAACFAIESDMKWLDKHYKLGGSTTSMCKKKRY